jgi:SAM-dependent methyltransferase
MQPLCESYLRPDQLNQMECFYPLHAYVCGNCFLVQLDEYVAPESIFSEYAYFSSYSETWLKHAKDYVKMIINRLKLNEDSQVVEIGSNDGYLLKYFAQRGIPVIGVEPAANVAKVAIEKGIPTIVKYFGLKVANELVSKNERADLLIGNNVLAQVPNLNPFLKSMKILIKPSGVITMEFPHLIQLIDRNEFDTIYHEHFSYFSFFTVEKLFTAHGLTIFDVDELPTHGGSLRIYARNTEDKSKPVTPKVYKLRDREQSRGVTNLKNYSFSEKVHKTKRDLLAFLSNLKGRNRTIVGYGAPGKGNTLLNFCGIRTDFLDYTVDLNPYKQGKFLPGTHIPIFHPDKIKETTPDYVLILSWNVKEEIMNQMSYISEWDGKFIVPIPELKVYTAEGTELHNDIKLEDKLIAHEHGVFWDSYDTRSDRQKVEQIVSKRNVLRNGIVKKTKSWSRKNRA